jgi:acyl-CoA synthetase (AMP-forming)/AMP-acid ligase II
MPFEPSSSSTLTALLRAQAQRQPRAPAILAPGRSPLTYADLWRQIERVAGALNAHGANPKTRVAVALPNGPEMATATLGLAANATCVPLDPACRSAELRTFLIDAGVRLVMMLRAERGPLRSVSEALDIPMLEIERDDSLAAGEFHIGADTRDDFAMRPRSQAHDHAFVLHTSGTTARPKIVPLTQARVTASAHRIAAHLALTPSDRCLNVMPLFHAHGLFCALLATLAGGASIVCTAGFDHRSFFEWIAQFEPTWYSAVPTIHQWIVADRGKYRQAAPAHRFRFVRSCSAALPPRTLEGLETLTGAPVIEAYGMTEASHQIASNPLSGVRKRGSVGVPTGTEIRLIDAAGRFLDAGAKGEIVVRGASVMSGYENDPEANAGAFIDGWLRTGDEGRFDDDGYLYVTGRIKDIIDRGGESISPREIDEALLEHEDVCEAAAFAVPHATLGQDIAAAVVLRHGARADETGLRRFLLGRLIPSKVPSRTVFVNAIPTEATGKVQRVRLFEKLRHLMAKAARPPATDTERSLEAIFRSVLDCDAIGADDNFFALGGDSLKAAQVMSRILAQHGVDLSITTLFTHGTIAELARVLDEARDAADKHRQALAAEIEQMSDEEVARLLAEEERRDRSSWT